MKRSKLWYLAPALGIAMAVSAITPSFASSHREAPLTAGDPKIDNTDVYAFVSPDNPETVTLISNWIPFEDPSGGPNFYAFAEGTQYDINIDNNGDATPDIVYRWTFTNHYRNGKTFLYNTGPVKSLTDETLNFYQTYKLEEIKGSDAKTLVDDAPVAPSNVGKASMPDYESLRQQAITTFSDGKGKAFAGQADDSFFLDLRVFDLLYGTNLKEAGKDTLNGYNVNTFALQVPKVDVAANGKLDQPVIGIWSTAQRMSVRTDSADGKQSFSGEFVQVSRLGNPLVNEVVVPVSAKDLFNSSKPADDSQFAAGVKDPEVPKLIEAIYKIKAPAAPRNDLVSVFLTGVKGLNQPPKVTPSEQLRLNLSIPPASSPNRLGVIGGDKAGYPNGRRLIDDVVDIDLQVLEGELLGSANELGDGVDANDVSFDASFPYIAMPHSGSDVEGTTAVKGKIVTAKAPSGGASTGFGGAASGSSVPVLPIGAGILGLGMVGAGLIQRRKATM